ncbi:hypothetical protein [Mycoavidus sp. B2-EB]|uniref:hypothetical protein n=1 Tax=Mycoavidus sp. B2-EB TaxID=2651972 RepID=UPI00162A03B0|nr:hypothetical protein [Mycoavidus sp. B2-EB]BBO59344.1 hypothetical protein MPB2EB_0460 [Mycoavidus sp. B2-EB]
MRKELLLIRAELERAELVEAGAALHKKFSYFSWLKGLLPLPTAASVAHVPVNNFLPRTYTTLRSALSLLLLIRPVLRNAKPLARWATIGVAVWKGVRLWRRLMTSHRR